MENREMGIGELYKFFSERKLSPVENIQRVFEDIQRHSALNAFVNIDQERALQQARASEARYMAGNPIGPLDGVPIGVKDIIPVAGLPMTMGCAAYAQPAAKDAFIVEKLLRAGVVVAGKTNTSQFAIGGTGETALGGPCRNPRDPSRVTGGSSCGSACAVGAGLIPGALGSDTGGSIRIPASLCGVVGMKPTFSLVSAQDVMPLSGTLDALGPLTRTVRDNALLLGAMAGYNPLDWRSAPLLPADYGERMALPLESLSLAVDENTFVDCVQPQGQRQFERAVACFEGMGAKIRRVKLPDLEPYRQAHLRLLRAGAYQEHERDLALHPQALYPITKDCLSKGNLSAKEYIACERMKQPCIQRLSALLEGCAALLLPSTPIAAHPIGQDMIQVRGEEMSAKALYAKYAWIANLTGWPEISVPVGLADGDMPIGLSILGPRYAEATLYQLAGHLEQALNSFINGAASVGHS